jgi:hypothetical protein
MRIRSTYQQSAYNVRGGAATDAFRPADLDAELEAEEALFENLSAYEDVVEEDLGPELSESGYLILDAEPIGFPDLPLEPPVWPYSKRKGRDRVFRVRGDGRSGV